MPVEYDLIVIGVGGMGSAVLYRAAKLGLRVLGLEQFGVGHDRGSSHGQTRIIRQAYYEHPNYVPMARRAFDMWREIEREAQADLLHVTGLLQVGSPSSELITGVRLSAETHQLPVKEMSPAEIESRWPYFKIAPGQVGLFEETAGYLRVEKCVAQMTRLALQLGAELRTNTTVESWSARPDAGVEVRTEAGIVRARRLIITAGPWSERLLGDLGFKLNVVRKQQTWFQTDRHEVHQGNGACCFLIDSAEGCFYGFPQIDLLGMKVAEHSGGQPAASADELDRETNEEDLTRVRDFLARSFRLGKHRLVHTSVCMYTRSPDEHFILDKFPGCQQVAFAAGLSGHGFKFAPVIGDHLVGLLMDDRNPDCDFLSLQRFAEKRTV
jgi:sarcosine oxidase